MQTVLTVDAATMAKMKATYKSNLPLPPGASFRARIKGVTITGYQKSGKVLFQGTLAEQEAARWGQSTAQSSAPRSPHPTAGALPAGFAGWTVLGSDEVGVGSYFGPLTTAAVYVTSDQVPELKRYGVADSKKLTDPVIIKLAKQILADCPAAWLNLNPPAYNARIKKYNQAQLKALCHNYVLGRVLDQIAPTKPRAILVDQFVSPRTYFHYLQGQPRIVRRNVYFQTKGERAHVAVAAASIVARYQSLLEMDRLAAQAGMTLPIGAGHQVDQVAARLLKTGRNLGDFAKLHFANTRKAEQLARR